MSSKIEQVITEIEDYIASCKYVTFSSTNIAVDKEKMDELLRDLRMRTPEEIKRYQKIISSREAILQNAKEQAEAMLKTAQVETDRMVDENEIMQQAYAQAGEVIKQATEQAQQIVDCATVEANNVKQSAMEYTFNQLSNLQDIVTHAIGTAEAKYEDYIKQLKDAEAVISSNRTQLYPQMQLESDIAAIEGNVSDENKPGLTDDKKSVRIL